MEVETQALPPFSCSLDKIDIGPHDFEIPKPPSIECLKSDGLESPVDGDEQKCKGFEMQGIEESVINEGGEENALGDACCEKAAVKLQKVYRSYRTRRRLADSAVVAEELW